MKFTQEEIEQIGTLAKQKDILLTRDLSSLGMSSYKVKQATELGILKKVSYGKYIFSGAKKPTFTREDLALQLSREISAGNFQMALSILREENTKTSLKRYYRMVLELLEEIEVIDETGVLPTATPCPSRDVEDLISHKNFVMADRENDLQARKNYTKGEYTLVGKLLKHIVSYTEQSEKESMPDTNVKGHLEGSMEAGVLISSQSDSLSDMIWKLVNGAKIEEPLTIMRNHLRKRGLLEYDYLIEALIRICIAAGDMTFSTAVTTIASLENGKNIDISRYLSDYETALESDMPIVAYLYMSIIYIAIERGHTDLKEDEVRQFEEAKKAEVQRKKSMKKSKPKGRIIKLNEVK